MDSLRINENDYQELPNEVWIDIFSWLDAASVLRCALVSRAWRALLYNAPTLWQNVLVADDHKHADGDSNMAVFLTMVTRQPHSLTSTRFRRARRLRFSVPHRLPLASANLWYHMLAKLPFWSSLRVIEARRVDEHAALLDLLPLETLEELTVADVGKQHGHQREHESHRLADAKLERLTFDNLRFRPWFAEPLMTASAATLRHVDVSATFDPRFAEAAVAKMTSLRSIRCPLSPGTARALLGADCALESIEFTRALGALGEQLEPIVMAHAESLEHLAAPETPSCVELARAFVAALSSCPRLRSIALECSATVDDRALADIATLVSSASLSAATGVRSLDLRAQLGLIAALPLDALSNVEQLELSAPMLNIYAPRGQRHDLHALLRRIGVAMPHLTALTVAGESHEPAPLDLAAPLRELCSGLSSLASLSLCPPAEKAIGRSLYFTDELLFALYACFDACPTLACLDFVSSASRKPARQIAASRNCDHIALLRLRDKALDRQNRYEPDAALRRFRLQSIQS
jgi:F-box-like